MCWFHQIFDANLMIMHMQLPIQICIKKFGFPGVFHPFFLQIAAVDGHTGVAAEAPEGKKKKKEGIIPVDELGTRITMMNIEF
jgi:hypothetical protein